MSLDDVDSQVVKKQRVDDESRGVLYRPTKFHAEERDYSEGKRSVDAGVVSVGSGAIDLTEFDLEESDGENGKENLFVVKVGGDSFQMSSADFERLEPEKLLNDNIIDFFIKYLELNALKEFRNDNYFYPTHFYSNLVKKGYNSVRKWTKTDIFKKKFLFVPINEYSHWKLVIVCNPGTVDVFPNPSKAPCILILDSLHSTKDEGIGNKIRNYLNLEWSDKKEWSEEGFPRLFSQTNMPLYIIDVPKQSNGSDCGIFLIRYIELFCIQPPREFTEDIETITSEAQFMSFELYTPQNINDTRRRITEAIFEYQHTNIM
eukprot:TRINITY_DN12050_c0_g1_i1.p1 TRINITY_DN12050_c0_g1~~TRINITY_DN12050_c0_g1_i1.p1  ORF type:complete len:317 (-),score=76.02 TRINITY_DN12050_c0_g1_i1:42-992(-)